MKMEECIELLNQLGKYINITMMSLFYCQMFGLI